MDEESNTIKIDQMKRELMSAYDFNTSVVDYGQYTPNIYTTTPVVGPVNIQPVGPADTNSPLDVASKDLKIVMLEARIKELEAELEEERSKVSESEREASRSALHDLIG